MSKGINIKIQSAKVNLLPAGIRDQYDVVPGVLQKFADSDFGFVDLSEINEDFAALLAGKGYLKKKSPAG